MRMRLALILLLILSLLAAIPAVAQDGGGEEEATEEDSVIFEISGVVTLDGEDVYVGEVLVAPSGAFNPSRYEGEEITIEGFFLNDDVFKATELVDDDEADMDDGEDMDEDDEAEADDMDADEEDCDADADEDCDRVHPVVEILAEEFDMDVEEIQAMRDDGIGIGNITKLLLLAEQADVDLDELLEQYAELNGSWGQLLKEYDVHPRDLAPGRVISGNKNKNKNKNSDDDDTIDNRRGNNGRGNGNNGRGNGRGNGKNK